MLAAVLTACSSPNPVLYTIAPVQGPVQPGGPKVIVVQQISTAHYLERSPIVRSSENYRLDVMSNDWWGEPLASMLSRVLTEELVSFSLLGKARHHRVRSRLASVGVGFQVPQPGP
jgi:hypothetical protein